MQRGATLRSPKTQDVCQGDSAMSNGMEPQVVLHKQESQKDSPASLNYRVWVSLQAAPVAKAWCSMQVVGMGAAFLRAHWHSDSFSSGGDILHDSQHIGVDALAVAIYITSYCTSAVVLLSRPHLCEACFVGNTLMRIFLAAISGLKLLPTTATFQLIINLNIEKLIEVLLMAPIEQVRLSWMIPLRVMLTVGYAVVYINNEQPYPWTSALLVQGSALLFQWLIDAHYRKVYAQRGAPPPHLKACGSADDLQQDEAALAKGVLLGSKAMHAEIEGKKIGKQHDLDTAAPQHGAPHPDAHMGAEEQHACSLQEPSSSSLGSGSASRPGMGAGGVHDVLSPPWHGRTRSPGSAQVAHTSDPLVFRGGNQHKPAGAATATHPMDPTTKARLQQVRKCLDRNRPKYTTHFCHHKASLKIPCISNPSALAPSALAKFGSLVSSSREKEVEVLSAAMRAGCILVVLDLREELVLLPDGKGGGGEDGLEHALATAAKQWLHDTNLAAEIVEETPVALQVNDSKFLCHLKKGGSEWRMQGPFPAAPSAGPHPELIATFSAVILPASTDVKPPAPSAGGGAASPAPIIAAGVAGRKGQQGADAATCASGQDSRHVVAACGSVSRSGSSTWAVGSNSSKSISGVAGHGAKAGGGNNAPAVPYQQDPLSSGVGGNKNVDIIVHVWLHVPENVQVEGWEGDGVSGGAGAGLPAVDDAASSGSKGDGKQKEDSAGASVAGARLSILARAFDKYLATHIQEVPMHKPAAVGEARLMEVRVSLPTALAALAPGPLCLELWSQQTRLAVGLAKESSYGAAEQTSKRRQLWGQQTLLGHCTQLLLPTEQAQIATELQSYISWDSSDGQDFFVDLCSWLSATRCPAARPPTQPHSGVDLSPSSATVATAPRMVSKHWALGMSLLQQAVLWGAPALARLLLECLLEGCPNMHATFAQVVQQGELLHLALLSSNQHAMLAAVLEWGRQSGLSRGKGFEWGWQEQNADGLTPLEIAVGSVVPASFFGIKDDGGDAGSSSAWVHRGEAGDAEIAEADAAEQQPQLSEEARMRAEAALDLLHFSHTLESSQLEELVLNLLDPTQPFVPIATAFEEQQQGQRMQLHREACKLHGHSEPQAFTSSRGLIPVPSALQSVGLLASSSSAAAANCGNVEPFQPPPRPQPPATSGSGRASLRDALRASLYGFCSQGKDIEEEYRSWCRNSTANLANRLSHIGVLVFGSGIVQSIRKQLYSNAAVMIVYAIPLIAVLLAKSPKKREFCMRLAKFTHWLLMVLCGLNILPSIIARKLALTRGDCFVECFLYNLASQVQLRALVTERLAQTFAMGLFYSSLNMPWPILQAVFVNLISLVVGIALDVRNRRTYMQICSSSVHAANKTKTL